MQGSGGNSKKLSKISSVAYGVITRSSYLRRNTFEGYFFAKIDAKLTSASIASHSSVVFPHSLPKT